jgi:hypothetical protein
MHRHLFLLFQQYPFDVFVMRNDYVRIDSNHKHGPETLASIQYL